LTTDDQILMLIRGALR